jgi:hypothetical protein
MAERHLAQAENDVRAGRAHVERQIGLLAELERDGHDTAQAKDLLATFREALSQHEAHRDRLLAELGTGPDRVTPGSARDEMTNDAAAVERFTRALGHGVLEVWSALPRETQQMIFEQAVLAGHRSERDESLREQLAAFLHDRNPRTGREEAAAVPRH